MKHDDIPDMDHDPLACRHCLKGPGAAQAEVFPGSVATLEAPAPNEPEGAEVTETAERNTQLLESIPEFGSVLARAYRAAVQVHPELAGVDVTLVSPEESRPSGASARRPEYTDSGRPEVHISRDFMGRRLALNQAPWAQESQVMMAQHIGISPEEFTPRVFFAFTLLHELQHTYEYLTDPDQELARTRRIADMQGLPVPGMAASRLEKEVQPGGKRYQWLRQNVRALKKAGYPTLDSLLVAQARTYRGLPFEARADLFAARILRENWAEITGTAHAA